MILRVFFAVALMLLLLIPKSTQPETAGEKPALTIAKANNEELSLVWQIQDLQILPLGNSQRDYTEIRFKGSQSLPEPGKPAIPYREFIMAIPEGAQLGFSVSNIQYEYIDNITPLPVALPGRDKKGISYYNYRIDSLDYNFKPRQIIEVSEPSYFRDLPIVHISFYPISYDDSQKQLKIIRSARINFRFSGVRRPGRRFFSSSKLDYLYDKKVINFEQAQNWLVPGTAKLMKLMAGLEGPWYGIEISTDGLYKITPATLESAGINVSNIDPRTFRLFNHGGKTLSINTSGINYGSLAQVENAIFVQGEQDGSFDQGDYILFYGKQLGGWHYSQSSQDFEYSHHAYDTKNYYWLTFNGTTGKRMQIVATPASGSTYTETYYMDRVHVEEDKYNLLASGNDWYGHRFFGSDGSASFNYPLTYPGITQTASLKIRFKSGNGVKYQDKTDFRYWFTVYLNPNTNTTPLLLNATMGSRIGNIFSRDFNANNYLLNGGNTFQIEYSGNKEGCTAYLDWIELYYPQNFQASNNYISFYTNKLGQIVKYNLGNFSNTDIQLFEVSDPKEVKILSTEAPITGGTLSFNLDLRQNEHKRLIASSLQSSQIKHIETLMPYTPGTDLLDLSLASDLIIITHPSLESYAREIITLRENDTRPLKGMIANTDDIYFYFSSGVQDPVAIRNYLRYAYYNWTTPKPAYVLLFGDGHYDYRNIALSDTNYVPPFEISSDYEINSRETDNFFADVNIISSSLSSITPDLAIGRLPVEGKLDARRVVDKLRAYNENKSHDGWQNVLTFVADDEVTTTSSNEWMHQRDTESLATLPELHKFLIEKIYLSAYPYITGGFWRLKPAANQAIIDQLNEGTLIINYMGHGDPQRWAHESVLVMQRDHPRIQNEGKLAFWIAATCDFGKYDDPFEPSFSEVLIWEENRGAIAVLSSARLVYAIDNARFNRDFLKYWYPDGESSVRLGDAMLLATGSGENDQKYHLFGDPSMFLADPKGDIHITSIAPDTLKALSKVRINGYVSSGQNEQVDSGFDGGAYLIVNDARLDSVNTGGQNYYTLLGPRIFKGEISVEQGAFNGEFIVPKSIRYQNRPSGRVTLYAWNESGYGDALGYVDTLLFNGTKTNLSDKGGPEIAIYFEDQEGFNNGDLVKINPLLLADLYDENGINLTKEVGHAIEIKIDEQPSLDITSFFAYDRDSYTNGKLRYYLDELQPGEHQLRLQAWDNLNNPTEEEINFTVASSEGLILSEVFNYPNPFSAETNFTFQAQGLLPGAEIKVKIYTISGRLIKTLDGLMPPLPGYNYYPWDGRDDDGDILANGVYLYKIILKSGEEQQEVIEKMVVLR